MKDIFTIKDREILEEVYKEEFGTLGLCKDSVPYSVPINFVYLNGYFYFHGRKGGKKHQHMKENPKTSFSIVQPFSVIPSYFRGDGSDGCAASHFFRSVMVFGDMEFVDSVDEKVEALNGLMDKYQPEGRYEVFTNSDCSKVFEATEVFKIVPNEITGKGKFGQHLADEVKANIIKSLQKREEPIDLLTIKEIERYM